MPALLARCGRLAPALVLSIWITAVPAESRAQVTLERYSPAETVRDGFYLSRPDDRGHLRFGFDLHLDYANDPLVLELDPGDADSEHARVVSHHLVAHAGFWVSAFERLVLFAGADVQALMDGDTYSDPDTGAMVSLADGTGAGDARAGARLRLIGENDDFFALAAQVSATFPVADAAEEAQNFSGESSVAVLPELLAELRPGKLRITVNAGVYVRENRSFGPNAIEDELRFGAGATYALVPERFDALFEVYGATSLEDPGNREATPLEFLAGGRLWFSEVCAGGLAGGAGLQRGLGSPDFRALGTVGCDLPHEEPPIELPEPEPDTDGDGLLDRTDGCPLEPEDRDGFEDENGCPDPDNDEDGVLDGADVCPLEPEDRDGFEDENGCPDPDNDGDGLLDAADRCPNEPEDRDAFEDEDGCPDPDNDKDGVLDVDDRCPTAPGTVEEHGCSKVRVDEGRIYILERVEFATNKDVILPRSEPILDEVRATLAANPQIKRVRIEGHTDSRGRDRKNMDLSRRRAASVVRWLTEHGITTERLEAYGCGENVPLEGNDTAEGRQANRRVEFHIIDPAPSTGVRSIEGCEPMTH